MERALICPPHSQIGPITPDQRRQIIQGSIVAGTYDKTIDNESAYERLKSKAQQTVPPAQQQNQPWYANLPSLGFPSGAGGGRRGDSLAEAAMKSAARAVGSQVGRQLIRGILGSLLGGSRR